MDKTQKLQSLQDLLIEDLIQRLKSGKATPADLNVARQTLRDNNVQALQVKGRPLFDLASLPFNDGEPDQHTN